MAKKALRGCSRVSKIFPFVSLQVLLLFFGFKFLGHQPFVNNQMNASAVEQHPLYSSPQIRVSWRALITRSLDRSTRLFNSIPSVLCLREATLMRIPNRKRGTIHSSLHNRTISEPSSDPGRHLGGWGDKRLQNVKKANAVHPQGQ